MGRWTNLAGLALGAVLAVFSHLPFAYELSAAEAPSLRGVYNALGGTMSPAWVAQDLGLFTKHGLQHSLNYLAATTAIQAIVGGTEEIGLVGNQGIDVALEGADTVYIASTAPRFIFRLYGDPAIKTRSGSKGESSRSHTAGGLDGLCQSHAVAAVWIGAGQGREDSLCR